MKITFFQMDISWEDKRANFSRVENAIADAAKQGSEIFILPEMFATGFTMNTKKMGERADDSETLKFLSKNAKKNNIWLVGTLIEQTDEGPKNAAYVFNELGQRVSKYYKTHLFPLSEENELFSPGTKLGVFEFKQVQIGLAICYDLRFPELFIHLAEKEVPLVVVLANWPKSRREHWMTLLRARAIENQLYIVGVNRVGQGNGEEYSGDSLVFDPWGKVVASAGSLPLLVTFDIDLTKVAEIRSKYPFLESRRTRRLRL